MATPLHASGRGRNVCGKRRFNRAFFAIFWAGENSSQSFFSPFFQETLWVWGMLGV
jgi:hypothetical protein